MSTCINPQVKGLARDAVLMRGETDTIAPIKAMGNVRRVRNNNPFDKAAKTQIGRPLTYSLEPPVDNNMNHRLRQRHSSPSEREMQERIEKGAATQRSISQPSSTIKESIDAKTYRKFRGPIGDSLMSSTSLILAASSASTIDTAAYVEKKFIDRSSSLEDLWIKSHDYKFENLVFEGGGNKGMAYVGALQILEEIGILKNIKRFAGASVGAMVATLAAVGYSSSELQECLDQDLRKLMVDHSCGYCSLIPNLLKGFGWNPGRKMNQWLGEQLKERTGDHNITFKEILRLFGTEICIVVTNLSHMTVEYFHPKTTPNTPVRKAVQMSMALPGVYQVVRETINDQEDIYVDGGLLCNYPIHAFDGWWLSMNPKDTFFKRLQPLEDIARLYEKSERFGTWNTKTLGIILYSNTETELMKTVLSTRLGNKPPAAPITKLSKQRLKLKKKQQKMKTEHEYVVRVVGRFMQELEKNNFDEDSIINEEEFRAVFENPINLLPGDLDLLFGENCKVMEAFSQLDRNKDGEITFQELMAFVEKRGVNLQNRFLGYSRREINHLGDFLQTLQAALAVNVKRVYVEKRDLDRTIGIDTDYIETSDFKLDPADKQFLIESGKTATRAYLYEYIKKQNQCDCDAISPSSITVQPEKRSTFDFRSQRMSSGSSTTSSYKSITPIS